MRKKKATCSFFSLLFSGPTAEAKRGGGGGGGGGRGGDDRDWSPTRCPAWHGYDILSESALKNPLRGKSHRQYVRASVFAVRVRARASACVCVCVCVNRRDTCLIGSPLL